MVTAVANRLYGYRVRAQQAHDKYVAGVASLIATGKCIKGASLHRNKPAENWRWHRVKTYKSQGNSYSEDKTRLYINNKEDVGNFVGRSDEVDRYIDHRGWYMDEEGYETLLSGVVELRCGKRGVLYIPVTWCDEWDGATLHLGDAIMGDARDHIDGTSDAASDCASVADRIAERMADDEREYRREHQDEE